MTLEDAIAETLADMCLELGGSIPTDKVPDAAKAIARDVEMFNELSSYGRPSSGDMIRMHVDQATKPLKETITDNEKAHVERLREMTRSRDEWRTAFYRLRDKGGDHE